MEEKNLQLTTFLAKADALCQFVKTELDYSADRCKGEDTIVILPGSRKATNSLKRQFKILTSAYFNALGPLLDSEVSVEWMPGSTLTCADMIGRIGDISIWLGSDMSASRNTMRHGLFDFLYNKTLYYTDVQHKRWFPTMVLLNSPIQFVLALARAYKPYLVPYLKQPVPSLHNPPHA